MNEFDNVIGGDVLTPTERAKSSRRTVLMHFAEIGFPITLYTTFYNQHQEAIEILVQENVLYKRTIIGPTYSDEEIAAVSEGVVSYCLRELLK